MHERDAALLYQMKLVSLSVWMIKKKLPLDKMDKQILRSKEGGGCVSILFLYQGASRLNIPRFLCAALLLGKESNLVNSKTVHTGAAVKKNEIINQDITIVVASYIYFRGFPAFSFSFQK